VLRKIPFIKPMSPTPAKIPPTGPDWLHEVKFDGWRMQLHVESGSASLYSKNGTDYTQRFRALKSTLVSIRAKSAVIDCELVACDADGDGQQGACALPLVL
jgi:bifunctional non-homologous end joining protein LigD